MTASSGRAACRGVVLHRDHARDRVDAARLQLRQQLGQVEERMVHHRSHRDRLWQIGLPVQLAVRLLDVDDHRIDVGSVDERQERVEAAGCLEDRGGRIERVDAERFHRHVTRHRRLDRQLAEAVARPLVDQRAALRDAGERVVAVLVGRGHRAIGLAVDEDVDPGERRTGIVGDRPDEGVVAELDHQVAARRHRTAGRVEAGGSRGHGGARQRGQGGGAVGVGRDRRSRRARAWRAGDRVAGRAIDGGDGQVARRHRRRRAADRKRAVLAAGGEGRG